MAIILIPSRNIYNIDHDKVPNNKIGRVEKSYYNIETRFGNVLPREYRFRYLNYDNDVDTSFSALYENPKYTEGFFFDLQTRGILKATLRLPVDKITYFGTTGNVLSSHQIKRTKKLMSSTGEFSDSTELVDAVFSSYQEQGYIFLDYETTLQDGNNYVMEETISLVGDYIVSNEETSTIGSGESLIKMTSNEIIQNSATNLNKYANDILSEYANGKETATVRCSIGDYYDDGKVLMVSTKTSKKMTFEVGDKVVPMVRNSFGEDEPMSLTQDGFAKPFEVVGTKMLYDGAVWQELTLRETTPEPNYIKFYTADPSGMGDIETSNGKKNWDGIIQYSTDLYNWTVWDGSLITINSKIVYFRGIGNTYICGTGNSSSAWFSGKGTLFYCEGNIENLLDYPSVEKGVHPPMSQYCFMYLFYNSRIQTPPSFPATTLSKSCYCGTFYSCPYLEKLPLLPATQLVHGCYNYMFEACSRIKISETKTDVYKNEYRIPSSGEGTMTGDPFAYPMFGRTGGTFKGNPELNRVYYTSNDIV